MANIPDSLFFALAHLLSCLADWAAERPSTLEIPAKIPPAFYHFLRECAFYFIPEFTRARTPTVKPPADPVTPRATAHQIPSSGESSVIDLTGATPRLNNVHRERDSQEAYDAKQTFQEKSSSMTAGETFQQWNLRIQGICQRANVTMTTFDIQQRLNDKWYHVIATRLHKYEDTAEDGARLLSYLSQLAAAVDDARFTKIYSAPRPRPHDGPKLSCGHKGTREGICTCAAFRARTSTRKIQERCNGLESYLCRHLHCRIQVSVGETYCSMHDCRSWRGHACAEYAERVGGRCACSQN